MMTPPGTLVRLQSHKTSLGESRLATEAMPPLQEGEVTVRIDSRSRPTVTENGASAKEGAIQNRGTLLAIHITVANNGSSGGSVGGLFAFGADTTVINSVFAGNIGDDCRTIGGTFTSAGFLSTRGDCTAELTQDPRLQPLADNGGVTQTLAFANGSPVIGAGDATFCLATDQRGLVRPLSDRCDLGAVEQIPIFANGFE